MLLSIAPMAMAMHPHGEHEHASDGAVIVRQTIPDPRAVDRLPLTSDRLSTTSTRYIDARRGFRPYSSVHSSEGLHNRYVGYDDHFGISRPTDRPLSSSQRTPRTYVQTFQNTSTSSAPTHRIDNEYQAMRILAIRDQQRDTESEPEPDMTIRIHNDVSAIPTTSGGVLITADGTVIQIGD